MSFLSDLQNYQPGGTLTCKDLPFLPACEQARQPTSSCVVGTLSATYSNGDPFMANLVETNKHGHQDRVYRNIELPTGMTFQLRNENRSDETFDQLNGGESIPLDVIEPGLSATFHLNKQDATLCRSMSYGAGLLPYQGSGINSAGATRYGKNLDLETNPSYVAGFTAGLKASCNCEL